MKVTVCQFAGRVAPRYDGAASIAIFSIDNGGKIESVYVLNVENLNPEELNELICVSDVHILLCGGIKKEWKDVLENRGIKVIDNVIGNIEKVIERLISGSLNPGDIVR